MVNLNPISTQLFPCGKVFLFLLICLLLCGCLAQPQKITTLKDFSREFSPEPVISLKGKKILTLEEAQQIALVNNPTCRAAACAIEAARFNYYRSLSAFLPEITMNNTLYQGIDQGYNLRHPPEGIMKRADRFSTGNSLQVTLLLFDGLQRELQVIIAKQEYRWNQAADQNVKRLLLRGTAYAYYDIILAAEEIRIYQADLNFQETALHQAEKRFFSGHVPLATVLNFKILAAKAQSRILDADYRLAVARNAFAALLGYSRSEFPAELQLKFPAFTDHSRSGDLQFFLEQAILNRPDLKQEKLMLDIAFRKKQSACAAFLPEISLFTEYALDTCRARYFNPAFVSSYYNNSGFSYGVQGRWNLFKGFDSINELRRQQQLEKIARWGLGSKFLEIITEVKDAYANCRNTFEQIAIYRKMVVWVLEQRELVYNEYWNGRETLTRVNEAQDELIEAESRLIFSQVQACKAVTQLHAAVGWETFLSP